MRSIMIMLSTCLAATTKSSQVAALRRSKATFTAMEHLVLSPKSVVSSSSSAPSGRLSHAGGFMPPTMDAKRCIVAGLEMAIRTMVESRLHFES